MEWVIQYLMPLGQGRQNACKWVVWVVAQHQAATGWSKHLVVKTDWWFKRQKLFKVVQLKHLGLAWFSKPQGKALNAQKSKHWTTYMETWFLLRIKVVELVCQVGLEWANSDTKHQAAQAWSCYVSILFQFHLSRCSSILVSHAATTQTCCHALHGSAVCSCVNQRGLHRLPLFSGEA